MNLALFTILLALRLGRGDRQLHAAEPGLRRRRGRRRALWHSPVRVRSRRWRRGCGGSSSLALLFFRELFISAFRVARLVLRARHPQAPATRRSSPFRCGSTSDAEITLLANLITLTPGTLSVDVSQDREYLYVHAIAVTGTARPSSRTSPTVSRGR